MPRSLRFFSSCFFQFKHWMRAVSRFSHPKFPVLPVLRNPNPPLQTSLIRPKSFATSSRMSSQPPHPLLMIPGTLYPPILQVSFVTDSYSKRPNWVPWRCARFNVAPVDVTCRDAFCECLWRVARTVPRDIEGRERHATVRRCWQRHSRMGHGGKQLVREGRSRSGSSHGV